MRIAVLLLAQARANGPNCCWLADTCGNLAIRFHFPYGIDCRYFTLAFEMPLRGYQWKAEVRLIARQVFAQSGHPFAEVGVMGPYHTRESCLRILTLQHPKQLGLFIGKLHERYAAITGRNHHGPKAVAVVT